jgi:BASS family bile acid:Na+ symporter
MSDPSNQRPQQIISSIVQWICRTLIAIAILLAIACTGEWIIGWHTWRAHLISGSFLCWAVASAGFPTLRKWAFTIWTITAVVIGMAYPTYFIGVGEFKFTRLFVPILQLIMFCMGTTLSIGDFVRVFRMPRGVLIGLVCQFSIMPLVGVFLAYSFGMPPEIAAGIILVGSSPSGLASNVMAYIAKADVALSVTMTAIATLLSPLMTPLLMKLLGGQMIQIDALAMMWSITKMVVIPIIGGVAFHHGVYHRAAWISRVMPSVSMLGIIAMTVLTVAIGRDALLKLGVLLILVCFLHTTAGFGLGYLVCRLLGLDKISCRTISLEVGLQNAGMASGIAATLEKVATLGLAPIVFGPVMNTTASILANWWRNNPVQDKPVPGKQAARRESNRQRTRSS